MNQVLPRWRNVLLFKNTTHLASFHSIPTSFEKRKKKWDPDVNGGHPSKSYIKYETRQKRADAKIALKNLHFNGRSSKIFEELEKTEDMKRRWDHGQGDQSDSSNKKGRSESSARRASKARHKNKKSKFRRGSPFDNFDEHPEPIFHATFGNRCYSWSFKSWGESSFQSSTSGFEWREYPNWTNFRNKEWDTASEIDSDGESRFLDSCSHRTILGLPLKGPLKIDEVKTAFRLAALKWHPDKHQGPSQAMAEDKFKHCVDAYKSLCNALASS